LGYIIPLALINDASTAPLRRFIIENYQIISIDCFPQKDDPNRRVFKKAKISTCIIIVQNKNGNDKFAVRTYPAKYFTDKHKQYFVSPDEIKRFDPKLYSIPMVSEKEWRLLKRLHLSKEFTTIDQFAKSFQGEMNVTNFKKHFTENPKDLEMLKGVEIGRYRINKFIRQGKKEWFSKRDFEALKDTPRRYDHIMSERIVTQQITGVDDSWRLKAVIVKAGTILANTTNYLLLKPGVDAKLVCAILNSKLMDWRFRKTSTNNHVNAYELDGLPIPKKFDEYKTKEIVKLTEKMLSLNERLVNLGEKRTDERYQLEEQISKVDIELNDLVYSIYQVTEEERKVIENPSEDML